VRPVRWRRCWQSGKESWSLSRRPGRSKGRGFLYRLLKLEARVCPRCKAYEKVYGVPAWEKPPA
jgi:hypothetical protein